MSQPPRQINPANVIFTIEESARVVRLIEKIGSVRIATQRLGVGKATIDAARAQGTTQRKTRDRLLEALDREEKEAVPA